MTRRYTHTPETSSHPTFGLVAWLESTRIVLPLRAVDCRFQVCGDLLGVEIDQVFHQNNTQALDCLYTFPLPAGAAVYRCEMHVNGRIIQAKVEEEKQARQLAAKHKAAGHRTALVEMDRENLFTLTLGNLQPGDHVVMRLAYFQTLSRLADWSAFHIPFCPGIRYIPGKPLLRSRSGKGTVDDTDQVPDASRICPPRMDSDSEDVATLFIEGTVDDPSSCIRELSSPSHPLVVRDGDKVFTVGLAEGCALPDQDFVLRWTEILAKELGTAAWSRTSGEESYAMVRIMPPAVPKGSGHTETIQPNTDVYFLLDHSGSMEGAKWQRTAEAFVEFLRSVGSETRVWLTLFNHGFRDFAEKPLSASELLQDGKAVGLPGFSPDGGTEVVPALRHVLQKAGQFSQNREATVVLITDGQIGNEQEVLELLRVSRDITLHVLGIDTTPNDAFLKALTDQFGGSWHQMHPNDDLVGTVKRLSLRLRPAALESLTVSSGWEPARPLPSKIYLGQSTVLLLKKPKLTSDVPLEISGLADGVSWRTSFRNLEPGAEAVEKLWQKTRIDEHLRREEQAQAISLAKTANLICRGAAFIAWDDRQKVVVAQKEVFQPALVPLKRHSEGIEAESCCSMAQPRVVLDCLTENLHGLQDCFQAFIDRKTPVTALRGSKIRSSSADDVELFSKFGELELRVLGIALLSTKWREHEPEIRAAWKCVVGRLLDWLASLPSMERERSCLAVHALLRRFIQPELVNDDSVREVLNWFGNTLPSDWKDRSLATAAIETMMDQLGSAR